MSTSGRWKRLRALARQVGPLHAISIALAKLCIKVMAPGAVMHYGQTGEDEVLQYLVSGHVGKRPGTYIDVGCNDARFYSTSYRLYLDGGHGLCIDLNASHAASFRKHRPRDRFICAALSDAEHETVVHTFNTELVTTISAPQAEAWGKIWTPTGQRTIRTQRLWDLYQKHLAPVPVDVLMLDVEGHEEAVLRGANLESLQPQIIVCEMHGFDLAHPLEGSVAKLLVASGYRLAAYATMNGYWVREARRDVAGQAVAQV